MLPDIVALRKLFYTGYCNFHVFGKKYSPSPWHGRQGSMPSYSGQAFFSASLFCLLAPDVISVSVMNSGIELGLSSGETNLFMSNSFTSSREGSCRHLTLEFCVSPGGAACIGWPIRKQAMPATKTSKRKQKQRETKIKTKQ